jgi:hypothetical protein
MSAPADRTGQAAIDAALARVGGTMPASGYCLAFTREPFAIPALYASAIDAWNAATEPHPDDRFPPPGVPVWFWSSSIYRHVAFHVGGGQIVTTHNADIRLYPSIDAMEGPFGPYMGWAYDDLNDRDVTPTTTPPEDDLPTPADVWAAAPTASIAMAAPVMMSFIDVDGIWMCDLGKLTRVRIPDPTGVNFLLSLGVRGVIDNQPMAYLFEDITEHR